MVDFGFKIELVLADSLYGEASSFIKTLEQYKLPWVLAIRTNHGVRMPNNQTVRANKWYKFERIFSNQKAVRPRADERRKGTRTKTSENRYIREIVFGERSYKTYWEITTDVETMPENSTSFIMTNIQAKRSKLKKILGNLYGLRTWMEKCPE